MPAILAGYFQREIHLSAVRYQRAVERGEKKVVGVNCYVEEDGDTTPIEVHRADPRSEAQAADNVRRLKAERDGARATRALQEVRGACRDGSNTLERFVAAAHADCTLGEIAAVLREEFGEYKEPILL